MVEASKSRANPDGDRPSPSASPGARKAVLVADDQLNVRNILEFNLKRRGFDVQVVHDGPSVLHAAAAAAPDLILLDIMMPGLDGFQVLERLRTAPETAAIPVLIVSARGSETDILRALQLGARDYVVKPFNLEVLFEKVQRALEMGGGDAGAIAEPFEPIAYVAVSALDGAAAAGLARRAHALTRAGARVVVADLAAAPVPDRAVLQRIARLRDDLGEEGIAFRLVVSKKTAAALDSMELPDPIPAFESAAAALAPKGKGA